MIGFHWLKLVGELEEKLLGLFVPVSPEFLWILINFSAGNFKGNGLIGLRSKKKILPLSIRRLNLLLIGSHKSVPWNNTFNNLWVINLEEQTLLIGFWILLLGDLVTRSTNLNKLLGINLYLFRRRLCWCSQCFFCCSSPQIGLMFFTLGMG